MNYFTEARKRRLQEGGSAGNIRIEGCFVDAKKHLRFENLRLAIEAGNAVAVVGLSDADTNGIGSIFNSLNRIEMNGTISIGEHSYSDRKYLRHRIFRLGDRDSLINRFSVLDNIFLRDRDYTILSSKYAYQRLKTIFEKYGVRIDPYSAIDQLSISEQIIVEIVRAYLHEPEFCVFGDVLSQVTDEYYEVILRLIHDLKAEMRVPILYLTTHFENVIGIADKIIVVRNQYIAGEFQVEAVKRNPKPLMYCLSGWKELNYSPNDNIANLQSLLLEMHNKIEFTEELKKILTFLAEDIKRILSPESCTVMVMDDGLRASIIVGDKKEVPQSLIEEIRLRALDPDANMFNAGATNSTCIQKFLNDRCYMYEPVLLNHELAGVILVEFEKLEAGIEADHARQILNNFAREIAVAIETSRLVGNSTLLQESHHRIKNNLQIIVNLLFMQKLALRKHGASITEAIDKVIRQVKSIALIHDLLSKGGLGKNLVNLKVIIQEIVLFYKNTRIEFELSLEDISIPYNKASTIALVINELITNSVKHAFPGGQSGKVNVLCTSQDGDLCIIEGDDGVGFPRNAALRKRGIGSDIIHTTVLKMGGSVQERNLAENGCAQTEIRLPRSAVYE